MMQIESAADMPRMSARHETAAALLRTFAFGLIAFLTVVDLFATQAILPSLVRAYGVSPAAMSFAVNASTIGMAISGLAVGLIARRIDRRRGILMSLALLSLPTFLLGFMPDIATFTALRVIQGVFMAAGFTLTLAYLAERCSAEDAVKAAAAYITGNVASNLFGRLMSAALADHLGLAANFYVFALLNLAGALLVYLSLARTQPMTAVGSAPRSPFASWGEHLRNGALRASFGIGFCILFAFIGTFTFVNFVLVRDPIAIGPMTLGFVYFVFLPSIVTTPLAGTVARRLGARSTIWGALAVAGAGLPLLLAHNLAVIIVGLALVGVGTFFAQACATGFVGHAAQGDRAAASGIYLASYFFGGLVGTALLGQVFDYFGWPACVGAIAAALAAAALLAVRLEMPAANGRKPAAEPA